MCAWVLLRCRIAKICLPVWEGGFVRASWQVTDYRSSVCWVADPGKPRIWLSRPSASKGAAGVALES